MPGQRYEAKERTVKKMSRDGLLEESLQSGAQRRVSNRVREGIFMREGEISSDVGIFRHAEDDPGGHRTLYAEQEAVTGSEMPADSAAPKKRGSRRQCDSRSIERDPALQDGSPEGGGWEDERPYEEGGNHRKDGQRKRADHFRKKEAGTGREAYSLRKEAVSEEDPRGEGGEEAEESLTSRHSARMNGVRGHPAAMSQPQETEEARKHALNKKRVQEEAGREEDADAEGTEHPVSDHSSRMDSVKGRSAALSEASLRTAADLRHDAKKEQVHKYAFEEKRKGYRLSETAPDTGSLSERKDEIRDKQKKERFNQEQRKQKLEAKAGQRKAGRLSFEDDAPEGGMVRGSGAGYGRKMVAAAAGTAAAAAAATVHAKLREAEDDNAGVESAHSAERLAESSVRKVTDGTIRQKKAKRTASRRKSDQAGLARLNFGEEPVKKVHAAKQEAEKKVTIRKFFQKQRYRRMYAAAKKEEKAAEHVFRTSQNLATKAAVVVKEMVRRNSGILIGLGVMGVLFVLISASVTSCTAVIHGTGSSVVSTTYASTDEEIHKVEDAYEDMERALNEQINGIGNRYPEYNNFRYQIDEISHNPYHLISYFTAKYGEFTYDQVKDELEEIFREQYGISTSGERGVTLTETKKVRVGESLGQVVTSGYCNCPLCCGQWSGGPTASGVYPTSNHTIAVDASNPFVPMGTHVVMNGVEYVVEDTGAFARYGVQFDVYYDDHQTAQNHGHKTWDAYLADSNGDREIEVTTTESVNRMSVTLTNHSLDSVLRARMNANEEKHYDVYNKTFGNRNYLFDLDKIPSYSVDGGYSIPPEALSDERFARMYNEARKYLGVPYVWGGYDPSGFDCSGFVSWVINHCGNGWNYGRLTADGIRQVCAYVAPSDARPGDIIFFERTYNTTGASHVGIYLGDGKMIHCGKPVQIVSLGSQYWQDHFLSYGRLP